MRILKYLSFFLTFITCNKISLIIDTDADIDDIFAISYILSNENFFDVKLITTSHKHILEPEFVIAKLLKELGKTNIPIGIGLDTPAGDEYFSKSHFHKKWLEDFSPEMYDGEILEHGIDKLYNLIKTSSIVDPIHILAIGTLTNIAALLERDPSIAKKIKVYFMGGALGIEDISETRIVEENIAADLRASQIVFNTKFDLQPIVLTTVDTSSLFQIHDENYRQFLHYAEIGCKQAKAILHYYNLWFEEFGYSYQMLSNLPFNPSTSTPKLNDVLAAISLKYFSEGYNLENEIHLKYEEMKLYVDDTGRTINSKENQEDFQTFLVAKGFTHDASNDMDSLSKEVLKSILLPCALHKNEN